MNSFLKSHFFKPGTQNYGVLKVNSYCNALQNNCKKLKCLRNHLSYKVKFCLTYYRFFSVFKTEQ